MREPLKTAAFAGAAVCLAVAAALVQPESVIPSIFSDQGQPFYPRFTDPQAARSIEVVDYDEATATALPLKVQFQKGRWLITSNYNYPVDAAERLTKTAAGLIDLRKEVVRSDSVLDHGKFGVIDPLDAKVTSLTGRGKRVTLRDAHNEVLADFILGKPVEGKAGMRYVRVPGEKRTYAVKTEADPSARFADWVNAGLLRIPSASIRKLTLVGPASMPQTNVITRDSEAWKTAPVSGLVRALDNLRIADVRPKPPSLAADLRSGQLRLTLDTAMSLRQRGFFLTPQGRVLASEGELSVETDRGVVYSLRFGDVTGGATGGDSRYLFASASARTPEGQSQANALNQRFAEWYYVIGAKDVRALQLRP